jgi:chromosome segregation ATPase
VKHQRAEMWREISRLQDINDAKQVEASKQADMIKNLNCEVSRVQHQISDLTKLIDARSHDLAHKSKALEDSQRQLSITRDQNLKLSNENCGLNRDNDRLSHENADCDRNLRDTEARNADLAANIRDAENRLKANESDLFATRHDNDCQRNTGCQLKHD